MAESIVDANVIVELLRGKSDDLVQFLEEADCAIDTTVYVELIQGAKNKAQVAVIERALHRFPILHFDEQVSRRTIDLIRLYSKSYGLLFADAVIAATCLVHGLKLITFNRKDFRFIEGLALEAPKL